MAISRPTTNSIVALLGRVGVSLVFALVVVEGVDVTVLSPETLQDEYGNTADKDSIINFVTIQDNQKYNAGGAKDEGSIEPFYNLAQSIIDTSLPGDFPIDLFKKVKDGKLDIGNDWQEVAVDYLGYIIAVVIGVLFLLIFPIIGCCFCCCRCCGRCGGRRVIHSPEEGGMGKTCWRRTALIILSVLTVMAGTGVALMFVTNSNLSDSLGDFQENDVDTLDDVTSFFDSTVNQAQHIIDGNFNFTLEVLFRDLDNIGFLLGQPIKDKVLDSTGLNDIYQDTENLETDAELLKGYMETLKSEKAKIIDESEKFHNFTQTIKPDVDAIATSNTNFANNVPSRDFVTTFNGTQLPDEDLKIIGLENFLNQSVTALVGDSMQKLNDIPEQVQNDTKQTRDDLKNDVDTYKKDVTKASDDIKSLRDDFLDGIDFEDMKTQAKDYVETAKEYDQYRWYGGLGLACVMTLIVLLISLGICFGIFGGNANVNPTERGSLSHAGGNLLTASVILIFIFGWLTMLITWPLFTIGAPTDKFVCQPLEDLGTLDEVIEELELFESSSGNSTWLGDLVYSDTDVNLKIADVLKACENGEGVYTALKMEEGDVVNLTELTDYSSTFDLDKELSNMNVGFEDINITTDSLLNFISFLKDFDSTMDYDAYNTTLSVKPVEPLEQFLTELTTYLTNNPTTTNKAQLESIKSMTESQIADEGQKLKDSITLVLETIDKVKQVTRQPPNNTLANRCDTIQQGLENVGNNMSFFAEQAFNESVEAYKNRIKQVLDTFVDDIKNAVKHELGVCRPLWNVYSDLVQHGVCGSLLAALSGWWCAMGWTLCFLVASTFASVSLSKHFVRMKYSEEEEKHERPSSAKSTSHHFQNKVFHSDDPVATQKW